MSNSDNDDVMSNSSASSSCPSVDPPKKTLKTKPPSSDDDFRQTLQIAQEIIKKNTRKPSITKTIPQPKGRGRPLKNVGAIDEIQDKIIVEQEKYGRGDDRAKARASKLLDKLINVGSIDEERKAKILQHFVREATEVDV